MAVEEDDKTTAVYRISLTKVNTAAELLVPGEQSEMLDEITDFHYLAFIRNPITKQATYIDAQAMVPTATLISIESAITGNNFPQYELQIMLMSETESEDNSESSNEQELIYSGFVVIIDSDSKKDSTVTGRYNTGADASIPTRLLLSNPIAYEMSKRTGFNVIFSPDVENQTNPTLIALETIMNDDFNPEFEDTEIFSFMDYVRTYAADESDIKQIVLADKSTVNLSHYGQITVPPTISEISVPEYIINTYKPFSTPSFWFFDTFNFANYDDDSEPENGKIPIWCILICFYNAFNTFECVDISEDEDINNYTHLLSTAAFNDRFGILPPNAVVNFINTVSQTCKTIALGEIPSVQMTDNSSIKLEHRDKSCVVKFKDDIKEAQTRIMDCASMFTEHIHQIEYYETTNTTPEWLQFGKLYNMEKDQETGINKNEYLHTPICIINVFKRRQTKDNTMECINKYAMIRLITPPEESE